MQTRHNEKPAAYVDDAAGYRLLSGGDGFDLHQSTLWQRGYLERGASRADPFKEGGVHLIHGSEIPDVLEQDGGFQNMFHSKPLTCQNAADVLQRLASLGGNVRASDGVTCGDVKGDVRAGDSVRCTAVYGGASGADGVKIQN